MQGGSSQAGREVGSDDITSADLDDVVESIEKDGRVTIEGVFTDGDNIRCFVGVVQIREEKSDFVSSPVSGSFCSSSSRRSSGPTKSAGVRA